LLPKPNRLGFITRLGDHDMRFGGVARSFLWLIVTRDPDSFQ